MGKPKIETKKVKLNMNTKGGVKKLAGLRAEGWEIQNEKRDRQYLSGSDTGWVTYVMSREKKSFLDSLIESGTTAKD